MNDQDLQTLLGSIANDCIAVRVRIINRVVTAVFDKALRPFGLKVSQMNILVACAAFGPTRPGELCTTLHLDPSTLSRNVERLRKRGFLETVPGEDSRTHLVRVLPKGLKTIEEAYPSWLEAQKESARLLGSEGVKAIVDLGNRFLGRAASALRQ